MTTDVNKPLNTPPYVDKTEWKAAKSKTLTDVVIEVGNHTFAAHKTKLMLKSGFFSAYFSAQPDEKKVTIELIDPAIFRIVLKFLYTGTVSSKINTICANNIGEAIRVLKAANYLMLPGTTQWASSILNTVYLSKKGWPTKPQYEELMRAGVEEKSEEIIRSLFLFEQYGDFLVSTISKLSLENLFNASNWQLIKKASSGGNYSHGTVLSNIERYNPFISTLLSKS